MYCTLDFRLEVPDIQKLQEKADLLCKDLERQNDMLRDIMREVGNIFKH